MHIFKKLHLTQLNVVSNLSIMLRQTQQVR
nr:MAG TPA: hypothetical protein [Caudoviricetes sp.]